MTECKNCQKYKKLYEVERDKSNRDRVWAEKAAEYAITAMQSNVDVLKTSLKKQGQS